MRSLVMIAVLLSIPFASGVSRAEGKTLASTLEIFVFPAEGQPSDQQSMEEAECYNWATSNTGSDPFELQKQSYEQQQQTTQQVQQAQSASQGSGA